MTTYVISGLKKKRAELAGQLDQIRADLRNVDGVLRLYGIDNPEDIEGKAKRRRMALFERGELMALVGIAEREGLTVNRKIAEHVMTAKGMDIDDDHLFRRVRDSVKDCRKRMNRREPL